MTFYTGQARLGGGQVVAWLFFMSLLCSPPGVLTSMESLNSLSWAHFTIMQAGETGEVLWNARLLCQQPTVIMYYQVSCSEWEELKKQFFFVNY